MKIRLLRLLLATLIFSSYSFAEELVNSHCTPVREVDGNISGFNCDDHLREKKKQNEFEQSGTQKVKKIQLKEGDIITSANGEPVESAAKAMELYNSMKASDTTFIKDPSKQVPTSH